jgi:hypothetical protein
MNCGLPSCVTTAADAARVSGQALGTRMSEIYLFRSPRPIRSLHGAVGWTPEAIAEHTLPALKPSFMPIDRSGDAFFLDLCEGDEGGHAQSHLY